MKHKSKDPTGYLLPPLVLRLGKLGESMNECNVFPTGQLVITPLDLSSCVLPSLVSALDIMQSGLHQRCDEMGVH
jgi:hypothetical protein